MIDKHGLRPIQALLAELGGWPVVLGESWGEDDISLMDLIIKLRHYNNKILIEQWVSADDKNSTVNIIKVRRVYSSTVFSFFIRSSLHWPKSAANVSN